MAGVADREEEEGLTRGMGDEGLGAGMVNRLARGPNGDRRTRWGAGHGAGLRGSEIRDKSDEIRYSR